MLRHIILTAIIALLASSSWAGHFQTWTPLLNDAYVADYGCDEPPGGNPKNRSSIGYMILRRLWERAPQDTYWYVSNTAGVQPGHELITNYYLLTDILRLVNRDYATASLKPRLMYAERPDLIRRTGEPTAADPRFDVNGSGCPTGSLSNDGTAKGCTWGSVPMCTAGVNAGDWCPVVGSSTYCPGSTCAAVNFDPNWVLTVPTAEHQAALDEADVIRNGSDGWSWDNDSLCDGTDVTVGDEGCGAGYPSFGGIYATALANLPTYSIGRALAVTQGVWPLASKPVYYGNSLVACTASNTPVTGCPGAGTYLFEFNYVGVDMRIPAYQKWAAARWFDHAYQSMTAAGFSDATIRTWPIALNGWSVKPGWWAHYDHAATPADNPSCVSYTQGTNMWGGPNRAVTGLSAGQIATCSAPGGLYHNTPYKPREYQAAAAEIALLLLKQTTPAKFCSAGSQEPYNTCLVDGDCSGPGSVCETARTHYFSNVMITDDDAPDLRGKKDEQVLVQVRKNSRWVGSRGPIAYYQSPPFSAPESEKICYSKPLVNAGGPYTVATGGSVRLRGSCVADGSTAAQWVDWFGLSGCTFRNPHNDAIDTGDPQALLKGCTTEAFIVLNCEGGSSDATWVTVTP